MQNSSEAKATRDLQLSVREALSSKKDVSQKDLDAEFSNSDDDDDEVNFDARMRQQILRKRMDLGGLSSKQKKNGTVIYLRKLFTLVKFSTMMNQHGSSLFF